MRKTFVLLALIIIFLGLVSPASARLVTLRENGEVIINVLSSEDSLALMIPQKGSLEVKEVSGEEDTKEAKISLLKEGNDIKLSIDLEEGRKELDVTSLEGELIEIEERPKAKSVTIGLLDGKFFVQEEGILALTDFPINIDPTSAELSLETVSGKHYLAVLPQEAYINSLKSKSLSNHLGNNFQIAEKNPGEVTYEIEGEKTINVFDLVKLNIPVKVSVSVLTGEVISIEQPSWLKVLGFLFS